MAERLEWVEIIEPRTKEHMYANLTTGECVWDPPPGVKIKKTDDNQWWELFDSNTSRFYYYNATSQKTVWHRPQNCDIIPLAKLQTLKQNTEVKEDDDDLGKPAVKRESCSTQTCKSYASKSGEQSKVAQVAPLQRIQKVASVTTQTSPSPQSRRRHHHHYHRHPGGSSAKDSKADTTVQMNGQVAKNGERLQKGSSSSLSSQTGPFKSEGTDPMERHCSSRSSDSGSLSQPGSLESPKRGEPARADAIAPSIDGTADETSRPQRITGSNRRGSDGGLRSLELSIQTVPEDKDLDLVQQVQPRRTKESTGLSALSPDGVGAIQTKPLSVLGGVSELGSGPFQRGGRSASHRAYRSPQVSRRYLDSQKYPKEFHALQHFGSSKDKEFAAPAEHHSATLQHPKCNEHARSDLRSAAIHKLKLASGDHVYAIRERPVTGDLQSNKLLYAKPHMDRLKLHSSLDYSTLQHVKATQPSSSHDYATLQTVKSKQEEPIYSKHRPTKLLESSQPSMKSRMAGDILPKAQLGGNASPVSAVSHMRSNSKDSAFTTSLSSSFPNQPSNFSLYSNQGANVVPLSMSFTGREGGQLQAQLSMPLQHIRLGSAGYNRPHIRTNPAAFRPVNHPSHLPQLSQFLQEQAKQQDYESSDDDLYDDDEDRDDDEDDFADDEEGASNNGDSSSQEYLDDNDSVTGRYGSDTNSPPLSSKRGSNYKGEMLGENSDSSSALSLSSPSTKPRVAAAITQAVTMATSTVVPTQQPVAPAEVQYASLKRNISDKFVPAMTARIPVLEKSQSLSSEYASLRPLSMVVPSHSEQQMSQYASIGSLQRQPNRAAPATNVLTKSRKPTCENDIENYAHANLNRHKKGIFGKKVPIANMLSWSKEPLKKPMIATGDKKIKREAVDCFKLIQMYMCDRKLKGVQTQLELALDLAKRGWSMPNLRDELFIQLCKQTTDNRRAESLERGWELMAILLAFFPPSLSFHDYLEGYIYRNTEPSFNNQEVPVNHYATHCFKKLERATQLGAKRGLKKPAMEEVQAAIHCIFNPSMFGNSLEDILALQTERFPERTLPWVQVTLSEEVLRLRGAQTEGIFRVPGDIDEVNALKLHVDQWQMPDCINDPHVPASLLKLWYRELYEPLIPDSLYQDCIDHCSEPEVCIKIVESLPLANRLVFSYLVGFLQIFAKPENVAKTKMDVNNLAMVMAPNCLRCQSEDPRVILDNTSKQMGFVRTLIHHLDVGFMQGVR